MKKPLISRYFRSPIFVVFTNFSTNISMTSYCGLVNKSIVPPDKTSWDVLWPEYSPVPFSIDFSGKSWADPDIGESDFKWNQMDAKVDRRSHTNTYQIINGFPLNPLGRTGISLRGLLGRWGPNHAADPIVTRWKRNDNKDLIRDPITSQPILQFVAILRKDTKEWAIPGGMVDHGEQVSATVKREFFEEALNSLEANQHKREELNQKLNIFFNSGVEIYRGCVDDPRNTDNAWMETVAINFHDDSGHTIGNIELTAGDDAIGVKWIDINNNSLKLYANHLEFIEKTRKRLFESQ